MARIRLKINSERLLTTALSYLYDLPVDILIQRDRQYTTAEGLQKMLNEYKSQLQDLDDEPENKPLRETLLKLVEQLSDLATKNRCSKCNQ